MSAVCVCVEVIWSPLLIEAWPLSILAVSKHNRAFVATSSARHSGESIDLGAADQKSKNSWVQGSKRCLQPSSAQRASKTLASPPPPPRPRLAHGPPDQET
eukprot:1348486-Pyramimonas_sp.AAC.1